ncbi:MAG TPA: decaprenyl-phosphate phosphoribosyltransferase [Candidatus Omnitrophota bacterium]|nr:decaprenyl-phosphate phosphoribosyltransferase [Candidatus Omnitrophota bacterium]HRZ14126.1 decaprenyl-phosphate phosphoribosyltransferase [Candidatus Omnitrophota bacterium]
MKHIYHFLRALRPQQWVKHFFVFCPLIFGGRLFSFPENINASLAFGIFCLASSAAYLVNDVIDMRADAVHPVKRLRPIAAGLIRRRVAVAGASALTLIALAAAFRCSMLLGLVIVVYILLNVLYSTVLKKIFLLDVACLAIFFLMRIIAGAIVAQVAVSVWILLLTVLLASFLGFIKRKQEMRLLKEKDQHHRSVLEQYDLPLLEQMITIAAAAIAVVYVLYTIDNETVRRIGSHWMIVTIPFVFFGLFRYLYLTRLEAQEGDPTRILLADRAIQINLALWLSACILIIYR